MGAALLQGIGFLGREFDAETGLCYYRARHYDPAQGRFLQSDPLGFAAGDLNLYAYTLTVLAVELDDTSRRVHNLEIADADTYFAGELEASGHNASKAAPHVKLGSCSVNAGLQLMIDWLGPGYTETQNGVF